MRVAEQGGRGVPHGLGGVVGVGVAGLAQRIQAFVAEETVAAGDRERHHHAVAFLQVAYLLADLDHFTHEFVAEHVAGLHGGHQAVIEMQVGPANGGGGDFENGVAGVLDPWVGDGIHAHVVGTVPGQSFHSASFAGRRHGAGGSLGERPS